MLLGDHQLCEPVEVELWLIIARKETFEHFFRDAEKGEVLDVRVVIYAVACQVVSVMVPLPPLPRISEAHRYIQSPPPVSIHWASYCVVSAVVTQKGNLLPEQTQLDSSEQQQPSVGTWVEDGCDCQCPLHCWDHVLHDVVVCVGSIESSFPYLFTNLFEVHSKLHILGLLTLVFVLEDSYLVGFKHFVYIGWVVALELKWSFLACYRQNGNIVAGVLR